MGPALFGEALRSMKAPGTAYDNPLMGKDPQPDHMSKYYAGPADNQGVHINSGIPNRAFYLVAMDIGTECAAQVWYHGMQNLWATANFADAVDVLVQSSRILTKGGVTPKGTPQAVRQAFHAVGL
jgi:Zn-dependent metalloprotease